MNQHIIDRNNHLASYCKFMNRNTRRDYRPVLAQLKRENRTLLREQEGWVAEAVELFNDPTFRWGPAHPQGWDFEREIKGYRKSYLKYVWEMASAEARTKEREVF